MTPQRGSDPVFSIFRDSDSVYWLLSSIFENLPNMVFVKDAEELRFVSLNRAAEELIGFTRQELLGRSDYDFFPREQADAFTAKDRAVLAGRQAVDIPEEPIRTRHHGERILHTKKVPILGDDGTPQYLLGISEDITELKRVESRLRESERQLRGLLEAIPDLIFRVDRSGRFLSFVPARTIPTLAPDSEFVGRTLEELLPADLANQARGGLDRAFNLGEAQVLDYDIEAGGARRYFEARIVPNGTTDAVAIVRDVTAQRRAQEEAQAKQRELAHVGRLWTLGEMATGIAHELNQPLAAILNHAEACSFAIRAGDGAPESLLEDLGSIAAQAERATLIIRHVRKYIRKSAPRTVPVDLNSVLRSTLAFLAFEARRAQVTIDARYCAVPPIVRGDPIEIEQVLLNLARNAIEALAALPAGEGRTLALRTDLVGPDAQIHVSNGGPRLGAERIEEFFTPYYTTKPEGLGLGLSISRSIVEGLGGSLEGEPGESGGVTFRVRIPMEGREGTQ